jgi:hypothetical protein
MTSAFSTEAGGFMGVSPETRAGWDNLDKPLNGGLVGYDI